MRLGTFAKDDCVFVGIIVKEQVIPVERICGGAAFSSMRAFLEQYPHPQQLMDNSDLSQIAGYPLADVQRMAPLTDPPKVICIGLNYRDHAAEFGLPIPEEPVFFNKFATSIIGPEAAIKIPSISQEVDYEVELALVIGQGGKNISTATASEHIAGYTIFNDVSARDLQMRGGQWVKGKALDTFAPIGPELVTPDEIADPHALEVRLWVNDELRQHSNTREFIFKIPQIIAFLSSLFTLEAGDIIATGTPSGVGFKLNPPRFLHRGDTVKLEIEQIGTLINPVK